jgi:hypothetical protein
MSKSLSELCYSIRNPLKGWISSQNESISDEFIYREIADARSVLLKKWYLQNKWIDVENFSQTCCLEVRCNKIKCYDSYSGNEIDSNEMQYYVDAPFIESFLGEQAIKYFGNVDLKHPYAKRSFLGQTFSRFNFYTARVPSYTRVNNRFIIENLPETGTRFVTLVAIFEDVLTCCTPDCIFPFPNHLIYELEELVSKRIMDPARRRPGSRATTTDNNPVNVETVSQKAEV